MAINEVNDSVYDLITHERNKARVQKDMEKVSAYSLLMGEIQRAVTNPTIVNGVKIYSDANVIQVLKRLVNSWKDNPEVNKAAIEAASAFIPSQMNEQELLTVLIHNGFKNVGDFMKFLKEQHTGLYDGKLAKKVWDENTIPG